jgi:hypothetical protein
MGIHLWSFKIKGDEPKHLKLAYLLKYSTQMQQKFKQFEDAINTKKIVQIMA